LPAIANSMITAAASAIRAATQPQDQSQAPESPFAILLATLSAQGEPAGDVGDVTGPSDAPDSSPKNQAGYGKAAGVAASEKSNADDHAAEAALAALLNTAAAPPPFSSPVPATETTASAPSTALADNDKSKAGANPQTDAVAQPIFAAPPATDAPINPAGLAPGDGPALPPESDDPASDDKGGSDARITDTSNTDGSTDPILFATANDLGAPPPVSGGKTDPNAERADAADIEIDPSGKARPEKKPMASDQSGTDVTSAMIAAAYAGPAAAGQASTDQTANPAVTVDTTQSLTAAPGVGAKPAKDVTATGPVTATPPDNEDTEELADVSPENANPIAATAAAKAATVPAKSAGVNAKLVTDKQTATDALLSGLQDKPQMPSAAHGNSGVPGHVAAAKTAATAPSPSDDNAKPVQTDSTPNTVPVGAAAAAHVAPPSPQPTAIFDPSAIVAPHATPSSGASPAAGLQITSAASDPAPDLNGFAISIAARSLSGAKQFEIRLDPPELGRVDVRLSIDATGKAVAHMATDQPQTLDLLRKDAPALTQALRDAGLDVSQNGLNFSLRGQDRQSGDSGGQGRKSLSARHVIQAVQAPAALAYAGAASSARLDIHV